jgi:SAM-dependent methyltransferase
MSPQREPTPSYCHACQSCVAFTVTGPWLRSNLRCPRCDSVVRERAVAYRVSTLLPDWRRLAIHEIAPAPRAFALKLKAECPGYVASHWFPSQALGTTVNGYRNENMERQTFDDASFDCVISLDVMEHVFDPAAAYREIFRTLRPGGFYVHTFPIHKRQLAAVIDRARLREDGSIEHLVEPPEYHGNPVDAKGSLVTKDYGYDIGEQIAEWAPFDVEISRFWDRSLGLMGAYSEVVVCRRPATAAA